MGPSWGYVGLSWPILGLCWPILRAIWAHLRAMLAHLGAMLAHLGPSWSYVGPSCGLCSPMLTHLRPQESKNTQGGGVFGGRGGGPSLLRKGENCRTARTRPARAPPPAADPWPVGWNLDMIFCQQNNRNLGRIDWLINQLATSSPTVAQGQKTPWQ